MSCSRFQQVLPTGAALRHFTVFTHHCVIVSAEQFQSLRLSFSPNLDDYNPDIPEWRRDISRVVKRALVEVSDVCNLHYNGSNFYFVPTLGLDQLFLQDVSLFLPTIKGSQTDVGSQIPTFQTGDIILFYDSLVLRVSLPFILFTDSGHIESKSRIPISGCTNVVTDAQQFLLLSLIYSSGKQCYSNGITNMLQEI